MAAPVSIPTFTRSVKLNALHTQKVHARSFEATQAALYRSDVIMRIIASEEEADQLEEVIHSMMSDIEKGLTGELNDQMKLLESHGINEMPTYESPKHLEVRITSPHVARYLQLVVLFDEYIKLTDALWLNGVLSNGERNRQSYAWQKRLTRFSSKLIQVENRARSAADRAGKGEEVRAKAPAAEEKESKPKAGADSDKDTGA